MKKRNIIGLVLLLAYLGAVAWCCFGHFDNLPSVQKEFFGIPTDKIVHFIMFLPFPILSFWTFDYLAGKTWKVILLVFVLFLIGVLLAAGTEIGQSFTSYRSSDPRDFAADLLALAVSSIAVLVIYFAGHKRNS
ncbi:MAG: VanZ family protein [Bacteroidales bacterium]|nr:VanZ family protein [Bacteroidales bacterium]